MALDIRSGRMRPRDLVTVVVRAKRIRREKIEAVLKGRAHGHRSERIGRDVGLPVEVVDEVIADRRRKGDPRALTDQQAAQAAAARARAERPPAPKAAPALPPSPPMPAEPDPAPAVAPRSPRAPRRDVRPSTLAVFDGPEARDRYVAMLRERGGLCTSAPYRGLLHLADLYTHCPTLYPSYAVKGGGVATLESTDRMFPRLGPPCSPCTSPAALCAAS